MRTFLRNLLALAALGFAACGQGKSPSTGNPLQAELTRLSGSNAKDCGLIALDHAPDAGWACARAADKAKAPFWFAVERRGIDSDIWEAIGRDSAGERYLLLYDSNPYGRPGLLPRFTREICPGEFVFTPSANSALQCYRNAP